VQCDTPSTVIVVGVDGAVVVDSLLDLSDEMIDVMYEQPMQRVIVNLQEAHARGSHRIVVVVPTTGMSGGAGLVAQSALAESARVLVKSAARQWGQSGITVNAVAVEPHWFDIDPEVSGPVSIAPRSLVGQVSPVGVVSWLCSQASGDITGQTIVCDGGLWM
jgi:NAD(P)-dependent dehydrogenase (short-subunit alcohol dehydrogenase family)